MNLVQLADDYTSGTIYKSASSFLHPIKALRSAREGRRVQRHMDDITEQAQRAKAASYAQRGPTSPYEDMAARSAPAAAPSAGRRTSDGYRQMADGSWSRPGRRPSEAGSAPRKRPYRRSRYNFTGAVDDL